MRRHGRRFRVLSAAASGLAPLDGRFSIPSGNPRARPVCKSGVSSKLKMGESSKMALTHPKVVASSAETLRRCVKHIAEGGRSERDLRDERSGPFDPVHCPGVGCVPQHGAPVPEIPGGHSAEAQAAAGVEAGPLRRAYRPADGRRAGELPGAGPGGPCHGIPGQLLDGGAVCPPTAASPTVRATMRFETAPGEQAQVDWDSLAYTSGDGKKRRIWVFVMTLGWSRACYVELVRKADKAGRALQFASPAGNCPGRCQRQIPGLTR